MREVSGGIAEGMRGAGGDREVRRGGRGPTSRGRLRTAALRKAGEAGPARVDREGNAWRQRTPDRTRLTATSQRGCLADPNPGGK
jgi:hypothetical protein